MRASVSYKSPFCCVILCCFGLAFLPGLSYAEQSSTDIAEGFGVKVKNAEISLQGERYVMSANIEYRLSPRVKEALQNGVPLFWDIRVKTFQHRDFFWDKALVNACIRYRIQYHALLNMYRVRDEAGGELYNFSTLPAALNLMSSLRDFYVLDKINYKSGNRYAVGIKVTLDRDALPLPLRPVAYTNPQWYLSSNWTLWPLIK